ncbi:hypothetical protein CDA63_19705, partial [Hymenobacter amundsenii]
MAALARDPHVGHYHFTVSVRHGQATVHGQVSSTFERERAADVAAGVSGVVAVANLVQQLEAASTDEFAAGQTGAAVPRPAGPDPDHALASRIRQRHFWSGSLHDQDIEVQVRYGRATLTGTV